MDLLKETRANHLGKLAFRWIYWNVLLPGRPVPLPALMSMAGKHVPDDRTRRSRRPEMPTTTIDSHEIHVDDEGFMTEYDEWTEDLGKVLAAQIGVELSDEHWKAIRFLRSDFPEHGETATLRRVSTVGGIPTRSCSPSFPRSRPRRWPTSPGCPSPAAACENRRPS